MSGVDCEGGFCLRISLSSNMQVYGRARRVLSGLLGEDRRELSLKLQKVEQ